MIGSTRSFTNPRTLSRTARSSSERALSMLKKSFAMGGKITARLTRLSLLPPLSRGLPRDLSVLHRFHHATGRRRDPNLARLLPKRAAVIDPVAVLVLPLVHHLVQQRVQRL